MDGATAVFGVCVGAVAAASVYVLWGPDSFFKRKGEELREGFTRLALCSCCCCNMLTAYCRSLRGTAEFGQHVLRERRSAGQRTPGNAHHLSDLSLSRPWPPYPPSRRGWLRGAATVGSRLPSGTCCAVSQRARD